MEFSCDSSPLHIIQMLKAQTYTTQIQVFHVTGLGFVSKPSSDLFVCQEPSSESLSLHIRLRSHSFTIYVIKLVVVFFILVIMTFGLCVYAMLLCTLCVTCLLKVFTDDC